MAEIYNPGPVRLWYRSSGFKEGLIVTGDFRGPNDLYHNDLQFTEDGDGLYYLDYNFTKFGTYVLLVRENDTKMTTQNFLIISSGQVKSGNLVGI